MEEEQGGGDRPIGPEWNYERRLASFGDWSDLPVPASVLADAGLRRIEGSTTSTCCWCTFGLMSYRKEMQPMHLHRHLNPRCIFLWAKDQSEMDPPPRSPPLVSDQLLHWPSDETDTSLKLGSSAIDIPRDCPGAVGQPYPWQGFDLPSQLTGQEHNIWSPSDDELAARFGTRFLNFSPPTRTELKAAATELSPRAASGLKISEATAKPIWEYEGITSPRPVVRRRSDLNLEATELCSSNRPGELLPTAACRQLFPPAVETPPAILHGKAQWEREAEAECRPVAVKKSDLGVVVVQSSSATREPERSATASSSPNRPSASETRPSISDNPSRESERRTPRPTAGGKPGTDLCSQDQEVELPSTVASSEQHASAVEPRTAASYRETSVECEGATAYGAAAVSSDSELVFAESGSPVRQFELPHSATTQLAADTVTTWKPVATPAAFAAGPLGVPKGGAAVVDPEGKYFTIPGATTVAGTLPVIFQQGGTSTSWPKSWGGGSSQFVTPIFRVTPSVRHELPPLPSNPPPGSTAKPSQAESSQQIHGRGLRRGSRRVPFRHTQLHHQPPQ